MSQNEKQPEDKPMTKPEVGERAIQLVDDAFRMVRLTKECGVPHPATETGLAPVGPNVNALLVRNALMMLAIHYNIGGSEVVDMARHATWRLQQENPPA